MKLIIVIASFILISNVNYSQENLGFIDYEKVQKSFPYYIKNLEKLETLKTKFNDSLINLVEPLEQRISTNCIIYSKRELEKRRNYLIKQQDEIEKFKTFALNKIKLKREQIENLTEKKISLLMKKFCDLKQISFISKKTDLLYCKSCKDYTVEFIKYINQKN